MQHKGGVAAGKNVLVTAAAGGTGHLAIQIAKLKGCHTIATCGSTEKVERLLAVGADRVINYKEEVAALLIEMATVKKKSCRCFAYFDGMGSSAAASGLPQSVSGVSCDNDKPKDCSIGK